MEAHVKFSKDYLKKLNRAHSLKTMPMYLIASVIFVGIGIFFLVNAIKNNNPVYSSIIIIVLGAIYYPLIRIINIVRLNKSIKEQGLLNRYLTYSFHFNPNSVNIRLNGDGVNQVKEYKYEELHKIDIKPLYIMLYINVNEAFYIPNKSICGGTKEELINFLKDKKRFYKK